MPKYFLLVLICLTTLNCYSEKKDYLLTDKAVFKKNKRAQSVRSIVKCKYCNGKGFIRATVIKRNKAKSSLKSCPVCRGKGYKAINIK